MLLRLSMGDYNDLEILENDKIGFSDRCIIWITWIITVFFAQIIFLNFVIAVVGDTF
jgi:hypothetical protein